ncbi:Uncharacterised protein [BD1-7 clade bacterium]|uniref:Cadherin domain-containing protein n=1 Tax=BD1-7 clade bacterium TaxID=2029982 RepID=A0A5S9QFA7_9GAMM|nr:Uncharacterised protein [BD1-7 clade bacterium]
MHMLTIAGLKRLVVLSGLIILTTACQAPPLFISFVNEVSLAGQDVGISVNVSGSPNSVTCFNGAVVMNSEDGHTYVGTVPQYLLETGENVVNCNARNDSGNISLPVGLIVVIPNIAPSINTISDAQIHDNNGSVAVNVNLLANGGDNLLSVSYRIKTGVGLDALPTGLSINSDNGRLVGTVDVDGTQSYQFQIEAVNLAGMDTSNPFTLTIVDGSP